jgi:hypothetical protein
METKATPSIASNALSLNLTAATLFVVSLNQDVTITFSTPPASPKVFSFSIQFVADGTLRSITWPTSVKWANATPPTMTSTNNKIDMFSFITHEGGTTWLGFIDGQNF